MPGFVVGSSLSFVGQAEIGAPDVDVPPSGSGSAATQPFAASGTGAEKFPGSGSAATQPYAASGVGNMVNNTGSGTAAVQPYAASGAGSLEFSGSGSAAVSSFEASGTGIVTAGGAGPYDHEPDQTGQNWPAAGQYQSIGAGVQWPSPTQYDDEPDEN